MLIAATFLIVSPDALGIRQAPTTDPAEQVAAWARESTDKDAVFAVPPHWAHFRSQSQRAIVVNFKAIPFHQPYMTQWFARLLDMAPVTPPRRGGLNLISALDSAYLALPNEEIHRLSSTYGFQYIVRHEADAPENFQLEYQADPWTVWRVNPQP